MPWKDTAQLESKLKRALDAFDWPEAESICSEIIERSRTDPALFPETSAKRLMQSLRRKRRFALMALLAEALLQSGLRTPQIRRQYAQGLIDQGILAAGEMVLQSVIQDAQGIKGEELEARGLTGRIYKQIYVNNNDPKSLRNRANLERALSEYLYVYRLNPQEYLWHGINVVALLKRAERDQVPLSGLPDAPSLARDILATLDERERQATGDLPAYDLATVMESHVALGEHKEATDAALRYIDSIDADAFEIYSTLRQLTEVWQLKDHEPPGNLLLPILTAGHLRKEGATSVLDPKKVMESAASVGAVVTDLEAIFGTDKMVTLKWYKQGLEQCNSVARVEQRNGKGHGTGWLVQAADFFPSREGVLLLTNAHVVSDIPNPFAIFPDNCQVNFQAIGQVFEVEDKVVWTSTYTKFDATFLTLKGKPRAEPLRIHKRAMQLAEPPPRLYTIGFPGGRDLEISLQDNYLLAVNEGLLHYRTPTEKGSSGSPIFEPEDWRVVGLHHKGSEEMARIDGQPGTYKANEGIAILALQKATQSTPL
jgi:Trypsin-like peptidase domain/MAP3K TRAFs-binding domain